MFNLLISFENPHYSNIQEHLTQSSSICIRRQGEKFSTYPKTEVELGQGKGIRHTNIWWLENYGKEVGL